MKAEIGIIGGTGFSDPTFLKNVKKARVRTPFGSPSDAIAVGELAGRRVAFIPRHGGKHTIRPTDVNFRANIHAMKELDVSWILAPATVGSLREEIRPGDLVFVDQFIDRTTKREESFYSKDRVCHISVADPMCSTLRGILVSVADRMKIDYRKSGTYICIEGPRFSTRAESRMFREWGADVVGMTLVPECVLAREAQVCYASIATVTDYDAWKDHAVTAGDVGKVMRENVEKVKKILTKTVAEIPEEKSCECRFALEKALV